MARPYDSSLIPYDAPVPYDSGIGTWAAHAARIARTPVMVVEVDLDWYADVGVTATNPDGSLCYRTPATTSQASPGTLGTKTRRWMTSTQRGLPTLSAIPCVSRVSLGAEEARLGRGLSYFGQATIELTDFQDDDRRAEDPFATDASRSGLDLNAGTYFSKLMERNPWWSGRPIRIIEGWATDGVWDPADALTHYFFVRDVQGPTDGRVRISAIGPLQQVGLSEEEAPKASEGRLLALISAGATTATIHDATIAADYPASGTVRIGDELMTFTRVGAVLTLTRGTSGTTAAEHAADDGIQLCLSYAAEPAIDIIEDLLTTYGGIDASLLDLAGWAVEDAAYLTVYNFTATIGTPTKVLDLVQEVLESSGLIMWWDDQAGLVRLRALRPDVATDATWTDRLHLMGRPAVARDIGERVSRADVLIDIRNPIKDAREATGYRLRVVGIPQGEEVTQHGTAKLKLIPSRWISAAQVSIAVRISYLCVAQLRDGRQTIDVEVAAKDASLGIADVVEVSSRDLVDRRGVQTPVRCMVIRREPVMAGSRYKYSLERIPYGGRFIYLCPAVTPDYSAATAAEKDPGWFLGPADGSGPVPTDPPYVLG